MHTAEQRYKNRSCPQGIVCTSRDIFCIAVTTDVTWVQSSSTCTKIEINRKKYKYYQSMIQHLKFSSWLHPPSYITFLVSLESLLSLLYKSACFQNNNHPETCFNQIFVHGTIKTVQRGKSSNSYLIGHVCTAMSDQESFMQYKIYDNGDL